MNMMMNGNKGKGRKLIAAGALMLLIVLSCAAALAAKLIYPFFTTTNDTVNMRGRASSSATILEHVAKGDTVEVLGVSGSYYKISYKNRTGYVLKQYVNTDAGSIVTPTPVPVETVSGYPYTTVTTDSVNLREKASTRSGIMQKIPKGAEITVESVNGSFAKVTYKSKSGYVKTDYITVKQVVKATATPKVTATPEVIETSESASYTELKKGDSGSAVVALQQALIELGYLNGTADGKFGSATENALNQLQLNNGYPVTGTADANLQAFIYNGSVKNKSGKSVSVSVAAPLDTVTLRLNNTGELVVTVQTRLKELGYYTGTVSGTYDKATKSAVVAFQKKNGLTADGNCGAKTRELLFTADALPASATATPKPTKTPKPTAEPTAAPTFKVPTSTVKRNSTGTDAKLVQKRLKELGYYKGIVDGKFGANSVKALIAFQEANGLTADGVAGEGTYTILFSYDAIAANATPAPAAVTVTPAPDLSNMEITKENVVVVKLGVTGDQVKNVQTRLTELGYYTATVDGVCKAADVTAIKAFQSRNGLKADGVAGYDTQKLLFSTSALTSTGSASADTNTYTTLKKGMTGDAVAEMQQKLIDLGYLTGKADGTYGVSTAEAVYKFQKANGLTRDGVAGAKTLEKLYSTAAVSAAATATPAPTSGTTTLRQGDSNTAVKEMQQQLISLGYLTGKADGKFGTATYQALVSFQKANKLTADGVAGTKTLAKLSSGSAVNSSGTVTATPAPTVNKTQSASYTPSAAKVKYANWYTTVKSICKKYPYATVYDFSTGISWQVHMFSLGAHADSEPLTANDTAKMKQAFGGETWNPKAVWVIFADGSIYMASTHSKPHDVQHITDNNFDGHLCIHFPRTEAQVAAIGTYATSHQTCIDEGWKTTQSMIK